MIREYIDKMLVILPFEEAYYRRRGVDVEFVGHPLLEDFHPSCDRLTILSSLGLDPACKTVAILAGSRRKEIDYILPTLLEAALYLRKDMPVQFLVSVAPSVDSDHIETIARSIIPVDVFESAFRITSRDAADILTSSDFAFIKSGTSSLLAALAGVPFLITYKISPLSWFIGSMLIRSSMKGLVNLIANERIVPEIFQSEATPQALARLALEYLSDPNKSDIMRSRLAGIREKLSVRRASDTAALIVSGYLKG
jgi:lipid-A-disaccharide synthase